MHPLMSRLLMTAREYQKVLSVEKGLIIDVETLVKQVTGAQTLLLEEIFQQWA